jgi:3-methyladenine DNA glycosylase/8-oxoguanine DNA glycosylase
MRSQRGIVTRLLHIDDTALVVNAWQRRDGNVVFRAAPADAGSEPPRSLLERAVERMRFVLGVDEDLRPFYDEFRRDPVLGPAIRRRPWLRTRRRPTCWEAFAWAITGQLIEASRARQIQRRMVWRWGREVPGAGHVPTPAHRREPAALRDCPTAAAIADRAPAELAACDLAPKRAIAMIRCARDVAADRVDLADPAADERLCSVSEIGPWTCQVLGLEGRGDPDSLPAGDLAYVKLVGRMRALGRRAEIPEIEEFFAPYEPYRGIAGYFMMVHYHLGVEAGPPLRLAA